VRERLRAPLAAAVALLIGGNLAVSGPAALLNVWGFLFPYLWLFLVFEAARRRRRLLDDEAFLLGAAVGLIQGGVLTKSLQDGVFFLGIDWTRAALAAFDWGLVTVLALHAADAFVPRAETEPEPGFGPLEYAALVFLPAAAVVGYLLDAASGRARYEKTLGPAWLLADLLFMGAAALLVRRALARAENGDAPPRDRGLWALAALAGWLPGAQLAARLGGEWLSAMSLALILAWTAAFGAWFAGLWRARGRFDGEPRRAARPVAAAAAWRLAGAALLCVLIGPASSDLRMAPAFTYLVELPVTLIFLSVFFRRRLAV
jgi:hypothetical protein